MTSFTTNGGSTWSAPKQVNNPPQRCAGGDISTNKQGHVFICWAGVTSVSPFSEVHVGVASSSNGGIDWNVKEKAFDVSGIQGVLSSKQNIRVNGLPRIAVDNSEGIRSGWIYIVTSEKNLSPAGNDPDIILRRSTDSGNTWSAGIRVNQDPVNTGKTQFFPAIHVDDNGGVNIIYYDDRNTTNDSSGVFLSRSTDGGDTWIDYEISDHNFKPAPIGGLGQGYQGDNIGLTSSRKILWPVWMDNSTGIYQVWSTKIDLTRLSINDEIQIEDFMLFQNYPNPINSSTRIEYSVSRSEKVKLKVYDLLGREIITLVDEVKPSGKYEIEFNASNLPSGVYLYSLTAGKFSSTKKLVVIK
ncbi:MAG: T9SS type A sorting domain-containing protein [Ignavibacteria bacterium]|nr:T9SS type A sorting domain-containing protein [Ignavibacteria bacterium]